MPSLPSRRGLLGGVAAGLLSLATGWLEPIRSDDAPSAKNGLTVSVVNDHALSHEVSVRVGSGESADEASTSVDGTANRNLASMLPEQSEADEYAVSVTVDGRRRASTTVQAETGSLTVRIDVIGTVDIERSTYTG